MLKLPSYRLHKPTGQGVATIRGKDYYFGKFAEESSKRKYRRLIAEYLISDHSPTFGVEATEYTMAGLAMAYLGHAKKQYPTGKEFLNIKLVRGPVDNLYAEGVVPVEIYQTVKCVEPLRSGRTTARESPPIKPREVCKITPGMVDRSNDIWKI